MLTIEKLNKSFDDNQVLKDIDLSFQPGETTVILGPSGSGKSTLLCSIDLLETPDSGSIKIDQDNLTFPQNLSFRQLKEYRGHFSIVFSGIQSFSSFDGNSKRHGGAYPSKEGFEGSSKKTSGTVAD